LILVDSSGWIEYLAALPKADLFAPYIEGKEPLVSSAIQIYEIYEVVRRDVSEERAVAEVSALRTTTIDRLPFTESHTHGIRAGNRQSPIVFPSSRDRTGEDVRPNRLSAALTSTPRQVSIAHCEHPRPLNHRRTLAAEQ